MVLFSIVCNSLWPQLVVHLRHNLAPNCYFLSNQLNVMTASCSCTCSRLWRICFHSIYLLGRLLLHHWFLNADANLKFSVIKIKITISSLLTWSKVQLVGRYYCPAFGTLPTCLRCVIALWLVHLHCWFGISFVTLVLRRNTTFFLFSRLLFCWVHLITNFSSRK